MPSRAGSHRGRGGALAMTTKWAGKWKGGRIYEDKDGHKQYLIEKMRRRVRYTIRLPRGVTDPEAELALFKRDPAGYAERHKQAAVDMHAVVLEPGEIERFEKYLRFEKHRVKGYISTTVGYLADWADDLAGRDMRKMRVDDYYRILDGRQTGRNGRIAALKSFSSFLVKRQRLSVADNAAALLEVVRPPPARLLKKRGYSIEQVEKFYTALDEQRVRDCFLLGAKTGMHQTEVARIASGEVELLELSVESEIRAVVRFIHKGRYDHRQALDAQGLAAVRRLMALGAAPSQGRLHEAIKRAARKLNVEPVHPKYLRHSYVTWGAQVGREVKLQAGGVAPGVMSWVVGHRSGLMVKDHYDNSEVPLMVAVPLRLHHPEDPTPLEFGAGTVSGRAVR